MFNTTIENSSRYGDSISPQTPGVPALNISKDNKLYHVFRFMQKAYGNDIGRFLTSFNSIMALSIITRKIESKKLKLALNTLKFGVPAFLHGADLYNNIKNYIKEVKEEQSPTYRKRIANLCKILDIKEINQGNIYEVGMNFEYDLVSWLTFRPNTKAIKVLGLYNAETLAEMDRISSSNNSKDSIVVKIEYKDAKYLLEADVISFGQHNFLSRSSFMGLFLDEDKARELQHVLTCEFIEGLSIDKNILYFNASASIKCKPRIKVDEDINQFDVPGFIKEIRQVLECGRKRAYVFVSRPGTGKSTILRKIEEIMTDTVIFHMSPDDLENSGKIEDRFAIAQKIPKSIMIIEDLDSCGMHEKNSKTGVFLDAIDDVNSALNMVILVTVNDTSRVHFSVINRPGRFDRIIEIKPPQKIEDIYAIMKSKAKKLKNSYCPGTCFEVPPFDSVDVFKPVLINRGLLDQCLQADYTQAEIADAVTEQIFWMHL